MSIYEMGEHRGFKITYDEQRNIFSGRFGGDVLDADSLLELKNRINNYQKKEMRINKINFLYKIEEWSVKENKRHSKYCLATVTSYNPETKKLYFSYDKDGNGSKYKGQETISYVCSSLNFIAYNADNLTIIEELIKLKEERAKLDERISEKAGQLQKLDIKKIIEPKEEK